MNLPVPRRRQPWGAVLTSAPWDGVPVPPEPVRIPATEAAPVPVATVRPTSRRRMAFGALIAGTPWNHSTGRTDRTPARAQADTVWDSLNDYTTLEVVG